MSDAILNEKPLVDNHCPFGCELADLDEHGYCRHLVGFTNDKKTFERQLRSDRGVRMIDATVRTRNGRYSHKVEKVDKRKHTLVNPITPQLDKGVMHLAQRWLSWRVYQEDVPEDTVAEEPAEEPEEALA